SDIASDKDAEYALWVELGATTLYKTDGSITADTFADKVMGTSGDTWSDFITEYINNNRQINGSLDPSG
ncbi:MAG: hypothetical protein JXR97_07195, partial [Planctomycetes bacterium]|nr:hypothetical protein [Planctomycetota bacterium]